MADLEKKLNELLHELLQKRSDLEDLQQRYNVELLSHRELQAELDSQRAEARSLHAQQELINKVLHRTEEGHSSARDAAVRNKLSLEAATRTIDAMKDQATKLHVENVKLAKQVENLERDMKSELFFRESCLSKQSKIQETVELLTIQLRNLAKDCQDTENKARQAISVGSKCQLMLEHKDKIIAQLQVRSEELSAQLVKLTSENRNLQDSLNKQTPTEKHYVKEILQEWQNSVSEMKTRIANSDKELETVYQSLQNALNAQAKFQKLEMSANERLKELEIALLEAKSAMRKNVTDCSAQTDITITIDIACQTSLRVADLATQTQDNNQDSAATKENDRAQFTQNNQTPSLPSGQTNNNLLSWYNLERDSSGPTPTNDLTDLPTQPNPRLNNI